MAPQSNVIPSDFARETAEGLVLSVRLMPKAARDGITGIEKTADGRACLAARVRAVPEKGKANAALEALIADALRIPKSRCEVISGGKSRAKQVLARGDPAHLTEPLRALIERLQSGA